MDYKLEINTALNENRYKKLIESLNVITYVYDLIEHRFIYVSRIAEEILGFPQEMWYEKGFWYEKLHSDDKEWALEFSRQKTRALKDHDYEYRMIAADGSVKWFKDITSINKVEYNPVSLQGVLIDITDRILSEEALSRSEEHLFAIFESAPIGMLINSLEGKMLSVNKAFCSMLGYTKEELQCMNIAQIFHPDDIQKNILLFKDALDRNQVKNSIEKRYLKKDGSIVYGQLHISIIRRKLNEPEMIISQVIDITEKKKAEEKLRDTENRFGTLLNNLHDIVFYETSSEGTFITDNVYDLLGYTDKELAENPGLFFSLIHPDDEDKVKETFKTWSKIEENTFTKIEIRLRKKDGEYIWIEDRMFAIKTANRSYWTGFMIDITDRKQSEKKLALTEHRLSSILNNLSEIVFYENDKDLKFISENIFEMLGYKAADFYNDRTFFSKLVHPEDFNNVYDRVKKWTNRDVLNTLKSEFRIRKSDGTYIWVEDYMFEVKTDLRKYWAGFFVNITERKNTESKLKETETRLTTIIDKLSNLTVYETGGGKNYISKNIEKLTGIPLENFQNNSKLFSTLIHPEDIEQVNYKVKAWHKNGAKDVITNEFRVKNTSGDYIWIEDHLFRVISPNNEPYLSGILIDVSDRKFNEEKVKQSLKEKEVLLKEIHHRVKNNLQVVSSLLKLQSSFLKDANATNILLESQNRVRSMALVHQKLYQSKDFAHIDFADYINQLTMNLMDAYKYKTKNIQLNVKSDSVLIGIDVAIPCGLIINELVSNSLKYAFDEKDNGKIDIILKYCENDQYMITIKDNGAGFPENIDFRNTKSLGMQLVNTLVNQIDGKIDKINSKGTTFTISFRDSSKSAFTFSEN